MKKRLGALGMVLFLLVGLAPRAEGAAVLAVTLPDYDGTSFSLDQSAEYDLLPVEDQNGVCRGYVDLQGKLAFSLWCDGGKLFHDGLAMVHSGNLCGYVDKTGQVAIPMEYADAKDFSEGLASVRLPGETRQTVINTAGEALFSYRRVGPFHEGLAWFQGENGKFGYVDAQGQVVVEPVYDLTGHFSEGMACVGHVTASGVYRYGFVNAAGALVIPEQYEYDGSFALTFSSGLAPAMKTSGGRTLLGYVDKAGNEVIPIRYTLPADATEQDVGFRGGWTLVQEEGIFQLLDTGGQVLRTLDQAEDAAGPFEDGWVTLAQGSRRGAVSPEGDVIPMNFTQCGRYQSGYAVVAQGSGLGAADRYGAVVVPCKYDDVVILPGGRFLVTPAGDGAGRFYLYGTDMEPVEPVRTAFASTQEVEVDGVPVTFQMYALRNAQGYETNFVRLREVALILADTEARFDVTWEDGAIWLTPGRGYTAIGGERVSPFPGDWPYEAQTPDIRLDQEKLELSAILLTQEDGAGHTYVGLRDLGEALGFNVRWDQAHQRVCLETDKGYDPSN